MTGKDADLEGGNRHFVQWYMEQMVYALPASLIGSTLIAYVYDLTLVDWVLLVPLTALGVIVLLGVERLLKRGFRNVT